jgi:hypothetical protein
VLHAVLAGALLATAACGRPSAAGSESNPVMRLVTPANGGPAYVEVTGLSGRALDDLEDAEYTTSEWSALLRVSVSESDDEPAVLGAYRTSGDALHFTPAFPFDPGRAYHARLDAARLPGAPADAAPVALEFGLPATAGAPSTVVERIYPSGPDVPENLLRMYVEFSAPMGRRSGIEYLRLVDDAGRTVEAAFLPLDYEFWSPDRRRFTVFFDPGRVKDGILPNQQMGRALEAGRTYTLVVSREWRDDRGVPLKAEHRHALVVGPARTRALDPKSWTVTAPAAGRRDPLVVTFGAPLDHGLLMRALGVRAGNRVVGGTADVDAGETRWTFTPDEPWRAGRYEVLALSILEDSAGNQIGRAFEIDNFDTVDKGPDASTTLIPFTVLRSTSE